MNEYERDLKDHEERLRIYGTYSAQPDTLLLWNRVAEKGIKKELEPLVRQWKDKGYLTKIVPIGIPRPEKFTKGRLSRVKIHYALYVKIHPVDKRVSSEALAKIRAGEGRLGR